MVAKNESNHEEGNSKEHSDASNQVDEVMDFLRNRGLSSVQAWG